MKETLFLPETSFAMRGNLPQNEPAVYKKWADESVFNKYMSGAESKAESSADSKSFNLHDGPPYANGHLHIGHALNKILKDIVIKSHFFRGESVFYTPGWDCHGLPIEQQVSQKTAGKNLPKTKIRELCRKHAADFVEIQKNEFLEFGVLGDYENPYKTMEARFEGDIFRALIAVQKSGLLAQRCKPIYWSWAVESALAEAEIEYADKVSDSIFVAFGLSADSCAKLGVEEGKIIIWTTTPWTLPANSGIALNPSAKYVLTTQNFIIAKDLLEKIDLPIKKEILKEFDSREFENLNAINPLNGRDSKIILGEHVSLEDGTGAVHTAPGHGEDDYFAGLKYGLEMIMPVDEKGCFSPLVESLRLLPNASEFVGVHVFEAQAKILELLGGSLLKASKITHSYPHCWRSHKPVIYRATTQWFILMDKPFFEGKTLRELALEAIESVRFYPATGKNRLKAMIENRPDWCISRQRDWGVPIAFFTDTRDDSTLFDEAVLEHLAKRFEKESCDIWWSESVENLLPDSHKHLAPHLKKGEHILDVWFDSGSTWGAVLKNSNLSANTPYNGGAFPADVYLEGSDQHRGWFQSSLLLSVIINHKAPYRALITHGFTIDEQGRKMSKSLGNGVEPKDVLKEHGSEILRLWVALSDYQNDLKVSNNIFKQVGEQYRKIRNTLRFLLANTNDLSLESVSEVVKNDGFGEIDRWVLSVCESVMGRAADAVAEYDFARAFSEVMNFISNELSGIYLDLCKDSLYCDGGDSKERLGHIVTMSFVAKSLLHFIAPTLTYTADEALKNAGAWAGGISVFSLRKVDFSGFNLETKTDFLRLLEIRDKFGEFLDVLKKEKKIKSSLEVSLESKNTSEFKELHKWLIVSNVNENLGEKLGEIKLENGEVFGVFRSSGAKCERCWQFVCESDSGTDSNVCPRCQNVLKSRGSNV